MFCKECMINLHFPSRQIFFPPILVVNLADYSWCHEGCSEAQNFCFHCTQTFNSGRCRRNHCLGPGETLSFTVYCAELLQTQGT